MKDLIIESTGETPGVNFNSRTGVLNISGRAYSSGIAVFFKTFEGWLDEYLKAPQAVTTIELHLDYSNSIFKKLMMNFIKKCIGSITGDKNLVIKWYYHAGDEDSIDNGNLTAKIMNFPIQMIEVE